MDSMKNPKKHSQVIIFRNNFVSEGMRDLRALATTILDWQHFAISWMLVHPMLGAFLLSTLVIRHSHHSVRGFFIDSFCFALSWS